MDAKLKLKESFSKIVKNSNIPYMLVNKEGNNISLIASSPKIKKSKIIEDIQDFVQSGAFFSYTTSLGMLPEGKTFSDTVTYRRERIELYGEVLNREVQEALLLVQINTQNYLENPENHHQYQSGNDYSGGMSFDTAQIIYDLKSKISESSIYINSLRKEVETNSQNYYKVKEELSLTEEKLVHELKENRRPLESKIVELQEEIKELKESISAVKNNAMLKFTSDLDLRKAILIVTAFISMLSSAGLLEGWVSSSVSGTDLENKVERLLELTDD